MKHVSKPSTTVMQAPAQKAPDILVSEVSILGLIDKGLVALHREMTNLLILSAKGKLEAPLARDLRDTVKLLFELSDRGEKLLKDKTDDELKAIHTDVSTDKQEGNPS
jgi:hypothetical protein